MKIIRYLFFIYFIILINRSFAESKDYVYMSLKFNEVNSRGGPNIEFPVLFTYKLRSMPVKIVGEYDKWYKIVDKDGDSGWVSEHLLSKTRTVIVTKNNQFLYSNYNKEAYPIYKIEKNVIGKLLKCKFDRCKIKVSKIKGWVDKSAIWGIDEEI
ncbi:MAG: SH3 domain-containing protein [Rickettsiales bacterium]|nr:SH3 domain-containing protein [Rickettsiales bacterium]